MYVSRRTAQLRRRAGTRPGNDSFRPALTIVAIGAAPPPENVRPPLTRPGSRSCATHMHSVVSMSTHEPPCLSDRRTCSHRLEGAVRLGVHLRYSPAATRPRPDAENYAPFSAPPTHPPAPGSYRQPENHPGTQVLGPPRNRRHQRHHQQECCKIPIRGGRGGSPDQISPAPQNPPNASPPGGSMAKAGRNVTPPEDLVSCEIV